MNEALLELIFWIVVFIAFFYGFKWLQNRKKNRKPQSAEARRANEEARRRKQRDGASND